MAKSDYDYKIVVDSSSNLTEDHLKDSKVGFEIVPMKIIFGGKEYVDNSSLDVAKMLENLALENGKASSSCPSPEEYFNAFKGAKHIICITISSKLSGSFNSARIASTMLEDVPTLLIDSKAVAGTMELLVDKAFSLISTGLSFEEISSALTSYRNSLNLLFVLNKFDNLVRGGRMSKIVAFIASKISIKPLCYADDGEIRIKEKIRTLEGSLKRLVVNIGHFIPSSKGRNCIICHTMNQSGARYVEGLIKEQYEFDRVVVRENRGLSAFYSLEGGIIVSF